MTSHVACGALGASWASLCVSSEVWMVAECRSVVLASFVAQVRGVMFYGLQVHRARLAVPFLYLVSVVFGTVLTSLNIFGICFSYHT